LEMTNALESRTQLRTKLLMMELIDSKIY